MIESSIVEELNSFDPDNCEWNDLDLLIQRTSEQPGRDVVRALLNLFERYPEHDGFGVFWSVIHALENMGSYEEELVKSIQRQPHEMSLTMLNRLLNDGINKISGRQIVDILRDVAASGSLRNEIKELARDFYDHHQNRT